MKLLNKLLNYPDLCWYILSNFQTYHFNIYNQIAFYASALATAVVSDMFFGLCVCPILRNALSKECFEEISSNLVQASFWTLRLAGGEKG